MSTTIDKEPISKAYEDVRSDSCETEWGVFKYDGNRIKLTGTGKGFEEFSSSFGDGDRAFGFIRINTGDELSKRAKFVLVTWQGPGVSMIKKAKMSVDKTLIKECILNYSVEIQLDNDAEFTFDYFKQTVDKAGGANYGTGKRTDGTGN